MPQGVVDWRSLPDDILIQLLSCLSYRDRASLSASCKKWRVLGNSSCLWTSLDLRSHKFDANVASSLASRCVHLQKLRFHGAEAAEALLHLRAKNLRELSGNGCWKMTDINLAVIAARHELLQSLQLGPDFCHEVTSEAIKAIAHCCPSLNKLRLSGIRDVNADSINALATYCPKLTDIGFIDCLCVDELALGNVQSVRFLSVAGTPSMKWSVVSHLWHKLPNLIGLDVSRTDIGLSAVSSLLSLSPNLKILIALNCPILEEETSFSASKYKNKLLISLSTDIFKGLGSLFFDNTNRGKNVFLDWRTSKSNNDKGLDEIIPWLEWMLSHILLHSAVSRQQGGLDNFWVEQGASLLLSLMQSSQEDVQERASRGLANFVAIDDENASIDCERVEAVMRDGGIHLLLGLAKSYREGLQSEAANAIANLSLNANFAKAVAEEGGIEILVMLARKCKYEGVQEQVARALANLSVGQEAGAFEALVQLTHSLHEGVRKEAAYALWNLLCDDRNHEAIAAAGGVQALVALARSCSNASPGLQESAAGALLALSFSEANSIAIGREGGVAPLIALARSEAEYVRESAAGALWNLSFNPGNALRIVEEGGVAALGDLCSSSVSKMTRFNAALTLSCMFDGRMDEFSLVGTLSESASKSVCLDGARRMAMEHIEAFIRMFSNQQTFAAAAASSAPAAQAHVTESACIQEAGHLECNGAEVGRFVTMLQNPSSILKTFAAFALLQFTIPGGQHVIHHASLMQKAGAARVLRSVAAATTTPLEAKIFARIVLRNLEYHNIEYTV
ncbi:unnamed protein product [Trifolium pratense]|uniref:Uncharacterized protein n=1 Tax=Trifolium pratense TaxID=57577 RepID=A0ACB0JXW3_TRIPR|nr:unnamed protein product [Trifolium pratense]